MLGKFNIYPPLVFFSKSRVPIGIFLEEKIPMGARHF